MTEYKRNPMEICKEFKDALCHFNLQNVTPVQSTVIRSLSIIKTNHKRHRHDPLPPRPHDG